MSLLPNFCSGGNSSDRNAWDANVDKNKYSQLKDDTGRYRDSNARRSNEYNSK